MEVRMVLVPAIIDGDSIIVVTEQGKEVSGRIPISLLRMPYGEQAVLEAKWRRWCKKGKARIDALRKSRNKRLDPWQVKIETWVTGMAIRIRVDSRRKSTLRTKLSFMPYSTRTWDLAAERMWHQANNRIRRHKLSPWDRWSQTASNNSNKRKGGRHASSQAGQGIADSGDG